MKLYMALAACAVLAACSPPKASSDAPQDASSEASPAAASSAVSPIETAAAELPAGFLGVWDIGPACTAHSDAKLTISQGELDFFESSASLRKVTVTSSTEVTVDADFSGEGDTWSRSLHMKLSDDGKTLKTDEGTDKAVTRIRCADKA